MVGDRIPGRTIVIAALDNLTKGSSGQALQNANLMFMRPGAAFMEINPYKFLYRSYEELWAKRALPADGCDCTHYCWSPHFWRHYFAALRDAIRR